MNVRGLLQRVGSRVVRLPFVVPVLLCFSCSLPSLENARLTESLGLIHSMATTPVATYRVIPTVTISGLQGTLFLKLNGAETLALTVSGPANFTTTLTDGSSFTITGGQQASFAILSSQQNWITQGCTLTGGTTGTISGADAAPALTVTCINNPYVQDGNTGLVWMRCSQGQVYRPATNDCQGAGAGPLYGAGTFQFCNGANDSCNDLIPAGESGATGHLSGTGTSAAFNSCDAYNAGAGTYGFTNWRVPWKDDLKNLVYCSNGTVTPLANGANCGVGYTAPTIDAGLFPDTPNNGGGTWSATASGAGTAWYLVFTSGGTNNGVSKTGLNFVRCIAGP